MNESDKPTDYGKPVAYDNEGRPLYAHPHPEEVNKHVEGTPEDSSGKPQVVYLTRAIEPHQQTIPKEIQKKHDESVSKYPHLNLSDGEFVISAVRRHPVGLVSIWVVVILGIFLAIVMPAIMVASGAIPAGISGEGALTGIFMMLLIIVLLVMGGVIATIVYDANRFYLTNESVTQHIQSSLFSKKNQTISLGNVEDASYRQKGILQTFLNYGSIRLSTEGEETTYRFTFVADPEEQIRLLNDAVEAFKNFRPISED